MWRNKNNEVTIDATVKQCIEGACKKGITADGIAAVSHLECARKLRKMGFKTSITHCLTYYYTYWNIYNPDTPYIHKKRDKTYPKEFKNDVVRNEFYIVFCEHPNESLSTLQKIMLMLGYPIPIYALKVWTFSRRLLFKEEQRLKKTSLREIIKLYYRKAIIELEAHHTSDIKRSKSYIATASFLKGDIMEAKIKTTERIHTLSEKDILTSDRVTRIPAHRLSEEDILKARKDSTPFVDSTVATAINELIDIIKKTIPSDIRFEYHFTVTDLEGVLASYDTYESAERQYNNVKSIIIKNKFTALNSAIIDLFSDGITVDQILERIQNAKQ